MARKGPRRIDSDEDDTRRRLLVGVDEAILAYQRLLPLGEFDPATLRALKQALINLYDDIEAVLLLGEPSDDEPYGDDGINMLATRAEADDAAWLAADTEPDPDPSPETPRDRRARMRVVRKPQ